MSQDKDVRQENPGSVVNHESAVHRESVVNPLPAVRIEVDELRQVAAGEIAAVMAEVADALNRARDGAIIADSEWIVREAMARFRQKVYEKAVQLKADKAAQAAFSPSVQRRRPSSAE